VTVRSLLRRCLQKDRDRRLHDIADARIEIEEVLAGRETVEPAAAPEIRRRPVWWNAVLGIAAALLAVVAVVAVGRLWPRPPPAAVMRFAVILPPEHRLSPRRAIPLAVAPDGTRLVYAAERAGRSQLFVREVDQLEAEPLPGSEDAQSPFFSPDGEWVGFFAQDGTLRRVSVAGGSPIRICAAPIGNFNGASWRPDDTIVFSTDMSGALWRVAASGGTPEELRPGQWPQILPDGKHVLFSARVGSSASDYRPAVLFLETGEVRALDQGQAAARYASSGHLVYGQSRGLMAVRFDPSSLEIRGSPRPVLDDVSVHPYGIGRFAVSDSGTLAYVPGGHRDTLEWVDREGRVTHLLTESGDLINCRVSPEGDKVACVRAREGTFSIWVYDLERGTRNRLTSERGGARWPAWTPDGQRVTFAGADDRSVHWRLADGSGPPELFRQDLVPEGGHTHHGAWSPDGQHLAVTTCHVGEEPDQNIWVVPLDGEPWPFVATEHIEGAPAFSPNGRWLAYVSNESGRHEVYVQAFPAGEGKWMISTNGGIAPTWSPDGHELFFRDQNGRTMMAASFVSEPTVQVGAPRRLFEGEFTADSFVSRFYDIAPDGERFLMIRQPDVRSLNVVVNWFEELERLVPGDG
jgi:serine/threonine-protein kinase